MHLYIPNIGEAVTLSADWTFRLFNEYRCQPFDDCPSPAEQVDNPTYSVSLVKHCTLPVGTVLVVDRVYLRQGLDEFASLSFRIVSTPAPWVAKRRKRFWAKLADVNQMQIVPPANQAEVSISIRPADITGRAHSCRALTPLDTFRLAHAGEAQTLAREARGLVLELEMVAAALRVQEHAAATGVDTSILRSRIDEIKRLQIDLNTRAGLLEHGVVKVAA